MHFLVLGATGAIGAKFCELALNEGHSLTLLVRNSQRLAATTLQHKDVEVIAGTLDDELALNTASKCGAETFVSFAGPPLGSQGTPLTTGYKMLIPKLISEGIKRILILCTPSFRCESDTVTFKWRTGEWFMKIFSAGQYREMVGIGEYITSLPTDNGVNWTLFRVGGLTNNPAASVEATYLGSGEDGTWINRGDVARWVLEEVIQGRWVHQAPYICNV